MTCPPCSFEQTSAHKDSPGLIGDDETLCRGAFTPMHGTAKVKASFIKDKDLRSGELSVWRLSSVGAQSIGQIVDILNKNVPADNSLWQVFGVTAKEIRELSFPEIGLDRGLCAVDDPVCDYQGATHPWHAVLRLCALLGTVEANDPRYQQIKSDLKTLFEKRALWPVSAEA